MGCILSNTYVTNAGIFLFYFIITIANTKQSDWVWEQSQKLRQWAGDQEWGVLAARWCFQPGRERWRQEALWGACMCGREPPPHPQHSHGLCNVDITSSASSSSCHFPGVACGSISLFPMDSMRKAPGCTPAPSTVPHTL